jgi:F420H(2)-dependent quinone reductase
MTPNRYQLSRPRRLLNRVVRRLVRYGLAGRHTYLLTVPRRKSGGAHTTPVSLVETAQGRWLVAPYGETGWVRNGRAAKYVSLSRAGRTETVALTELTAADAAPVLRDYLRTFRVVQPFFDVRPTSPLEAFASEAARHPVFEIHSDPR